MESISRRHTITAFIDHDNLKYFRTGQMLKYISITNLLFVAG